MAERSPKVTERAFVQGGESMKIPKNNGLLPIKIDHSAEFGQTEITEKSPDAEILWVKGGNV